MIARAPNDIYMILATLTRRYYYDLEPNGSSRDLDTKLQN